MTTYERPSGWTLTLRSNKDGTEWAVSTDFLHSCCCVYKDEEEAVAAFLNLKSAPIEEFLNFGHDNFFSQPLRGFPKHSVQFGWSV